MSYRRLIDSSLRMAFNSLKDLAVQATLLKNPNEDFNFNTGEVTGTSSNVPFKAVVIESKKTNDKSNTTKITVLSKTSEIGKVSVNDTMSYNGENWKLTSPIKNDGAITTFEATRENSNG